MEEWAQSGIREGTSRSTAEWPEGSSETEHSLGQRFKKHRFSISRAGGGIQALLHTGQTLQLSSYLPPKGPDFKRSILSQSKKTGLASGLESNLG